MLISTRVQVVVIGNVHKAAALFMPNSASLGSLILRDQILCVNYNGMEKAMATHSSTLAWRVSWMEEVGRLQSMRLLRVGHN